MRVAGALSISLSLLVASAAANQGDEVLPRYDVPLISGGVTPEGFVAAAAPALRTSGLVSIDMGESFVRDRQVALQGLCRCAGTGPFRSVQGTDESLLSGNQARSTLATATVGDTPLSLPLEELREACGTEATEAMEGLRDAVATAAGALIRGIDDQYLRSNHHHHAHKKPILESATGRDFYSVSSIVQASSNLEHFHLYSSSSKNNEEVRSEVLPLHTDAGLFLAFVPGLTCGEETDEEDSSSLIVQVDGERKRAVFAKGSVGLMLGVGAEHWLDGGVQLKATRHAVQMAPGTSRAWYGMMYLVPQSAIVQKSPEPKTFGDMRQSMVLSGSKTRVYGDHHADSNDIAIGCGTATADGVYSEASTSHQAPVRIERRRRLQMVEDASVCNNVTNFYCWMSCLDIPQVDTAEERIANGESLYCMDPRRFLDNGKSVEEGVAPCKENGVIGGSMNSDCLGVWTTTSPTTPGQEVVVSGLSEVEDMYCFGGTSMYMDGFHWLDSTCVIYLFPDWVLSTPGKLAGAAFGSIIFAMLLEGVIRGRRDLVQAMPISWRRLGVSAIIYGMQLTLGYLLMLVVMTYSGPLFMSVILGLMFGHVAFNAKDVIKHKAEEAKKSNNKKFDDQESEETGSRCCSEEESQPKAVNVPEGSTPCCQNAL